MQQNKNKISKRLKRNTKDKFSDSVDSVKQFCHQHKYDFQQLFSFKNYHQEITLSKSLAKWLEKINKYLKIFDRQVICKNQYHIKLLHQFRMLYNVQKQNDKKLSQFKLKLFCNQQSKSYCRFESYYVHCKHCKICKQSFQKGNAVGIIITQKGSQQKVNLGVHRHLKLKYVSTYGQLNSNDNQSKSQTQSFYLGTPKHQTSSIVSQSSFCQNIEKQNIWVLR